nr:hypothetical protein [Tanacetum cinerariifolium]
MTEVVTTVGATTIAKTTKVSVPKRRRGVVIQDPEETTSTVVVHSEIQSKDKGKELNADINWNAVMKKVKRSERLNDAVMKYQALKRKPLTKAQARKIMIIYLKNMAGFKMNYFKGMTYKVTVPEKEVEVKGHKREGKSLENEITNKQKMDKEVKDLKSHLQIVSNNDDDVYTKATPLASKIPIVDYKIPFERNKPYIKIIKADGNHVLFLRSSTMLKNFDREDLESLWKLVKERSEMTKPKNYIDDYLLKTLRTMFEQPDVEASIWKDQKGRYGLAKRYPLTHFTLEQMLNNVRLEVEEVSEMSLELLRIKCRGYGQSSPMLVESDYESWKIRIERYIHVTEGQGAAAVQVTRDKTDEEFTEIENNRDLADIQATNILSQGLPRHVFNILNQTRTGKEIWHNVELLRKGSESLSNKRRRNYLMSTNDFLDILAHQMNTKFVNNLPPYWAKYVTNVKNNKDISATTYVELYTYLKSYEPHDLKTLRKQARSLSIVDYLAYLASTTYHLMPTQPTNPPPSTSSLTLPPQPAAQSSNDVILATINQIVNLLSGFQKQFPPTNNQLRTSSNSRSHATVHDGQIVTETVQRKALGNVGNTGTRGIQSYGLVTDNKGKLVICYNCRGEGHVLRQCKEKKRVKDDQYFKDKILLMEGKEKGAVLDVEAEAFLADVECTAPYDPPLAITTTNIFKVSHEDTYDSDVDEGPHAAAAFMANLSSTSGTNGATTSHVNKYQFDSEVQDVPTEVSSVSPGEISMITILDDLRNQLDGHIKVNQEQSMVNDSLRAELARWKIKPINYVELNALYSHFVPQKELSREQVYWLPAEELATQKSNPPKPVTPFVHTHPASKLVQSLDENLVKEVTEFMRIYDELDKEYEQCVQEKKKLQIEKKNLLIQNECLITNCIAKDICSIVLASDRDRPLSEEMQSNCVRKNSKVIELEAEILKHQQMLAESDKRILIVGKSTDIWSREQQAYRNLVQYSYFNHRSSRNQ